MVVIDDEPDLRVLLATALTRSGQCLVVGTAGTGREGTALVERERPDGVLLDLRLPGGDGRSVLPDIRALVPDGIVVILSAEATDGVELLAAGADAVLDKMGALSGIATRVVELLDQAAARTGRTPTAPAPVPPSRSTDGAVTPTPEPATADAVDAVDAVIGTLVHDLRTPLTVISGFAATLAQNATRLPADQLGKAAAAIERQAAELTSRLLRLAEVRVLRVGSVELASTDVDVGELARRHAGPTTSVHVEGDVRLDADPERLAMAITEVVDNARRFGGADPVTVDVRRDGDDIVVAVRDAGPGLPPGDAPYAAFERLDSRQKGGGVGLFLARGLVEAHGGTVTHASPDGGGTVVTLRLPVR